MIQRDQGKAVNRQDTYKRHLAEMVEDEAQSMRRKIDDGKINPDSWRVRDVLERIQLLQEEA